MFTVTVFCGAGGVCPMATATIAPEPAASTSETPITTLTLRPAIMPVVPVLLAVREPLLVGL